jgi:NADH dehydrogenase
MPGPKKILIIGGGFAGLACAQKLANDSRFEVTLVDRRNHHLFQPLLYQVATASLAAPDIARSLRGVLAKAANVSVFLDDILTIDCEAREARAEENTYPYDSLILATGATTSYFGKTDWERHTVGLKTLDDAQAIRRRVLTGLEQAERSTNPEERQRLMTVVIVGAGPTGVELAGAFSDLVRRALKSDFRRINPADFRILLIQSGDRVLKSFEEDLSSYALQRLEALGVEVCLGTRVDAVEEGRVHLSSDRWIEASTIIWAAGVQASSLTACLPGERDRGGRLLVDPDLSLPDRPEVFAAGDIVSICGPDGEPVPGLAPAASQMGRHIAGVLREDLRLSKTRYAHRSSEFRAAFRYRDKGIMAIIGKNCAVTQAGKFKMRGMPAWAAWLFIHLLFLIGFRNKLAVLVQWAWAYVVDQPGARVVTGKDDAVT